MESKAWHAMDAGAVLEAFGTDPARGLASDEVRQRLERHGPNELAHEEKASAWSMFFAQFKNILIVILIVATILSAVVGEYVDAAIILVIIVFCAVLGFVQEYRAERALEALKGMLAPTLNVLRDGEEREVPSRDLVPGDILVLEAGDKIAADARIVEVHSLQCDEAPLTGESAPVGKELAPLGDDAPVADRKNMVFTGTIATYGRGRAVVTATGMHTEFGKIAREVAAVETERTPLERRTQELGRWLGIITLGVCVLVVGVSLVRELAGGTFDYQRGLGMMMFAIALAVAAVPEALAAIVTGALAIAMHEMAKRNALVRKMPAVETLGCTSVICTDKTGTLTKGEMTVRRVYAAGRTFEVSGVGYAPEGQLGGSVGAPIGESLALLLKGGLLSSDALLVKAEGRWSVRGDPTEGALVTLAGKGGIDAAQTRSGCPRIAEFPFSSERKRMTTVHAMDDGRRLAFMKGAAEVVLERCASVQDERAGQAARRRCTRASARGERGHGRPTRCGCWPSPARSCSRTTPSTRTRWSRA